MIGFIDTVTLAVAKLKTRRIMMFITVLVAGLMFSVLFASALVVNGVLDSFNKFDQASDQSYLVKVFSADVFRQMHLPPLGKNDVQARAEANQHYLKYIEEQKALAKQQKIKFDEKSVKHPINKYKFGDREDYAYNYESPVIERILLARQQKFISQADSNLQGLKKRAMPFNPVKFYQTSNSQSQITGLKFIKNGKENLIERENEAFERNANWGEADARASRYRLEEDIVMKNLILPANDLRRQNPQAVPVVITATEAQALFGQKLNLSAMPTDNKQLIKWVEDLRRKINGQTYQACYRNNAENELLEKAVEQQLVKDKKQSHFSQDKPKIVYNLPTTTCGQVTVKQDNRTPDEKKQDEAATALAKQKGEYQAPHAEIITFQVVGVFPSADKETRDGSAQLANLARDLLANYTHQGAVIPLDLYRQLPNKASLDQIFFPPTTTKNLATSGKFLENAGFHPTIVEFATYQDATDFIDFINGAEILNSEQHTEGIMKWLLGDIKTYYRNRTVDNSKHKFYASPFGRNFVTLQVIKRQSRNFVMITVGIISLIAMIILSLTMARVMSDSRHETAIFRAVGARRGDVAKIYLSYSLIIAVRIIIISLVFGAIISLSLNSVYSEKLTILTKLSYGLFNQDLTFKLFAIEPLWLAVLALTIVVMSLVAVIPPMLRNIVRNPIKDIKDQ